MSDAIFGSFPQGSGVNIVNISGELTHEFTEQNGATYYLNFLSDTKNLCESIIMQDGISVIPLFMRFYGVSLTREDNPSKASLFAISVYAPDTSRFNITNAIGYPICSYKNSGSGYVQDYPSNNNFDLLNKTDAELYIPIFWNVLYSICETTAVFTFAFYGIQL